MTVYSANPAIINASLVELSEIFLWNDKREKNSEEHSVVLIGGWAVHAYNPWYGSVDSIVRSMLILTKYFRTFC